MMNKNVEWMSGHFGIMCHYLPPLMYDSNGRKITDIDESAEMFDIPRFMEQFDATGAEWLLFTFGQNCGVYVSPSEVMTAAGAACTKRDLMLELAQAVKARGKRFIAYLPAEVMGNTAIRSAMGWNGTCFEDSARRQPVFMERYAAAFREWSLRFGNRIDGWWLDGAWLINETTPDQWKGWFDAMRAGNPNSAIALNRGDYCVNWFKQLYDGEDYLAGECEVLRPDGLPYVGRDPETAPLPPVNGPFMDGTTTLWHVNTPIDAMWMHAVGIPDFLPPSHAYNPNFVLGKIEDPIYSDEQLSNLYHHYCDHGGAVTFNIGILADGTPNLKTIEQIRRVTE